MLSSITLPSFPRRRRAVRGICHGHGSESAMTLVQLRVVMAGLDLANNVLATGTGDTGNRVDARVKPAHDDLQLVPIKTQQPIPVPRTALTRKRESRTPGPRRSLWTPAFRGGDEYHVDITRSISSRRLDRAIACGTCRASRSRRLAAAVALASPPRGLSQ